MLSEFPKLHRFFVYRPRLLDLEPQHGLPYAVIHDREGAALDHVIVTHGT